MEISALAQQVEQLAQSLSTSPDSIDPQARVIALEKLVELKRLEQLKAIAESKSNSTYFFGDRCEFSLFPCSFLALPSSPYLHSVPFSLLPLER